MTDDPVKAYARKTFEEVLPSLQQIREAAAEGRYREGVEIMNALNTIESVLSDVVGEYLGTCMLCEEALFADEAETYTDDGDQVHATCAAKDGR